MSNVVKAKLRIARSIKSVLGNRWTLGKPIVTTDTGELYVGLGDNIDAVKITDFIQVNSLPLSGLKNKIYIKNDTNQIHIWDGSKFNTLSGDGGIISYAAFKDLPSTGTSNTIYVILSDENFYPTSGKSIYVWDTAISKYVLCSRAVAPKSFGAIKVNDTLIGAKNKQDQIEIKVGEGLSITGDSSTNTITIKQTVKPSTTVSKRDYNLKAGNIANLPINLTNTRAEVIGDDIYILGGYNGSIVLDTIYKYNITSNEMTTIGTIPSARQFSMTCVYKGNIYLLGGRNNSTVLNDFWVYDVDSNSWVEKPKMNIGRYGSFCEVIGDKLWIIGGRTSSPLTNTIECYDFITGQWELLDSTIVLPTGRFCGGSFVFDNKIYCIGGKNVNDTTLVNVEEFDTSTLTWSTRAPLPAARWGSGCYNYNGLGYVILGNYATSSVKSIYIYNQLHDKWIGVDSSPISKGGFASALYGNKFYIFGGNSGGTYYNTCSTYAVSSGRITNYAILNVLTPFNLLVLNMSTGESAKILALAENDIWYFGSFTDIDVSIILTEKH